MKLAHLCTFDVKLGTGISKMPNNILTAEEIVLVENQTVGEDDFVFVSNGTNSTILEVQSIRNTAGNEKVTVRDLVSGDKIDFEDFTMVLDQKKLKQKQYKEYL